MPKTKKGIMRVLMGRAEKGAALMDISLQGWHKQIDLDRLNLVSSINCILGQCFEEYSRGVKTLKLHGNEGIQLGFCLKCAGIGDYPLLTACWKTLINQRLANDEQETQTAALPTPPKNALQRKHPTTTIV